MIDIAGLDRGRALRAADTYLKEEPVTVTASRSPRSAGGPHDFSSEGDYWWPDSKNPNGPYIQRDGMTNPDNFVAHRHAMVRMSIQVAALTAAWRLTGSATYARHALRHLHAWFTDDKTRMNPDLQYAQAIKGVTAGRGIGVIDTVHLIEPARSAFLLGKSSERYARDLAPVRQWFASYLRWMNTSKNGQDEKAAENNHGTCWVMQVAAFAALTEDSRTLAECRQRFKEVLLPNQMASDGSFPRELKRTKPYGYALFNLDAMASVCRIASVPGDDLWAYTLPDGRNMHRGTDFLYPYIKDKGRWPYAHDVMFWDQWPVRSPALLFAGLAYKEARYLDVWKTLEADSTNTEVLRNLPLRQPVLWVDDTELHGKKA
jgi:hypothetical protein